MDSITIGLSIAIVVVLILLYSCSSPKKKAKQRPAPQQYDDLDWRPAPQPPRREPSYGTGKKNARANRRYQDLANVEYRDYNEIVQDVALDDDVFESQEEWGRNSTGTTSGASGLSERSDDPYPVPWVGLRRPNMDVPIGRDARTEPSQYSDQFNKNRKCPF